MLLNEPPSVPRSKSQQAQTRARDQSASPERMCRRVTPARQRPGARAEASNAGRPVQQVPAPCVRLGCVSHHVLLEFHPISIDQSSLLLWTLAAVHSLGGDGRFFVFRGPVGVRGLAVRKNTCAILY